MVDMLKNVNVLDSLFKISAVTLHKLVAGTLVLPSGKIQTFFACLCMRTLGCIFKENL